MAAFRERESEVTCLVCGGPTTVRARGFVAPWISEMAGSDVTPTEGLVCEACDLAFFSHRFSDQELEALYSGYRGEQYVKARRRWEPWYLASVNTAGAPDSAHVEERRRFMLRLLAGRGPFACAADFGGDEGQFFPDLEIDRRVVVDPSGKPLPDGVERVARMDQLTETLPDLVIIAHVLEHLNDPVAVLSQIRQVMAPGGLLYAEVPQDRPVWSGRLGERAPRSPAGRPRYVTTDFLTGLSRQYRGQRVPSWGVVKQSEHLNYFSERALRAALAESGFDALDAVVDPHSTVAGLRMGRLAILARPHLVDPGSG